jgi:hypothetical protein
MRVAAAKRVRGARGERGELFMIDAKPNGEVQAEKRPKRKPRSDQDKPVRMKALRDKEPDFMGKFELAHHLQCHIGTLNDWIADGTIPPPHSRPGTKHPVWLRKHYEVFKKTRAWPKEAYWNRQEKTRAAAVATPEP